MHDTNKKQKSLENVSFRIYFERLRNGKRKYLDEKCFCLLFSRDITYRIRILFLSQKLLDSLPCISSFKNKHVGIHHNTHLIMYKQRYKQLSCKIESSVQHVPQKNEYNISLNLAVMDLQCYRK